jgi:predicted ATPase
MGSENGGRANGAPGVELVVGYVSLVQIENIRSIASLRWEVTPGPGWNVVLGDNGAGKSTFLRAIAAMLLSTMERGAIPVSSAAWARVGATTATIRLAARLRKGGNETLVYSTAATELAPKSHQLLSEEDTFTPDLAALFGIGFGPSRRFTGGDTEYVERFASAPRVARYLSLFDERVSLADSLAWLKLLRFKELEGDAASTSLLQSLRTFVNQDGFLPGGASLDRITSDHIFFIDGNGAEVPVEELSDGYRSILSLAFELIRQLAAHHGPDKVFDAVATAVVAPGIVLVDEIDAHLHPRWQRRIGVFLRKCFPNIQFIVTTHLARARATYTIDVLGLNRREKLVLRRPRAVGATVGAGPRTGSSSSLPRPGVVQVASPVRAW